MGALIFLLLFLAGCASSDLVPTNLKGQISRDVSFTEIKQEPEHYQGKVVVIGGYVLGAKAVGDHTQIEVLQLPLKSSDRPITDLMKTKGRFFAFSQKFLDLAVVPPGSYVSMVAEVLGSQTAPLDDRTYTYPTFTIKTFKVWPKEQVVRPRPFPFWDRWSYPFDDPWTHPYWGAY